ncbi:DNA sulfur modification protein DndE [Amphritea pacifica]|uniref:DNA sulfur modification protein DndE n=1 Tax=Amphritea pacifica TaxID=2811233 RepID=UPI001965D832|nr:DNA sulfur modification protein DndE [Amphritea pacifica]MBN1006731.1 DNA sulfur modification protein DndE [Amphritea pacifica]
MIETVYVSEKGRSQLSRLKVKTGIRQWNHLCRWAYCLSLKENSIPPYEDIVTDSSVEMTWQTFAGEYHEVYWALLKTRLQNDGIEANEENMKLYFKLHLHRGISYLNKNIETIEEMFNM